MSTFILHLHLHTVTWSLPKHRDYIQCT